MTATLHRVAWGVLRAPLLAVLMLCEPIVRWACSTLLVLGLLVSIVFELSPAGPRFPFLAMIAASLGWGLVLIGYYGLMGLLAK
jgi:hypothetical protein